MSILSVTHCLRSVRVHPHGWRLKYARGCRSSGHLDWWWCNRLVQEGTTCSHLDIQTNVMLLLSLWVDVVVCYCGYCLPYALVMPFNRHTKQHEMNVRINQLNDWWRLCRRSAVPKLKLRWAEGDMLRVKGKKETLHKHSPNRKSSKTCIGDGRQRRSVVKAGQPGGRKRLLWKQVVDVGLCERLRCAQHTNVNEPFECSIREL